MQKTLPSIGAIREREERFVLQTYKRKEVAFVQGEGCYLFDNEGRRYLDFGSGIAVNALGHNHPALIKAIHDQSKTIIHTSNLYYSLPMVDLAEALVEQSFAAKVFFCNSGAEANEAALKFARRRALKVDGSGKKHRFVAFNHGFHGRTFGSLSVTGKPSIQEPFRPLLNDVTFAELNDNEVLKRVVTPDVAAVIVEPIQGEGGVHPANPEFLREMRSVCDQNQVTLIFDEVQCGLGRTGKLWDHEHSGVQPDIMTLAKPLGGGLPLGATLLNEPTAMAVNYGDHGSTFGANPLATAAGLAAFRMISEAKFLHRVETTGEKLRGEIENIQTKKPGKILAVRGRGLMLGIDTSESADALIQRGLQRGLVLLSAGERTLRLLPPLIIEDSHIGEFAEKFAEIL